jgi:hypothetical protein
MLIIRYYVDSIKRALNYHDSRQSSHCLSPDADSVPRIYLQNKLGCFCECILSAIFWAIRGALPPARWLMMRFA